MKPSMSEEDGAGETPERAIMDATAADLRYVPERK